MGIGAGAGRMAPRNRHVGRPNRRIRHAGVTNVETHPARTVPIPFRARVDPLGGSTSGRRLERLCTRRRARRDARRIPGKRDGPDWRRDPPTGHRGHGRPATAVTADWPPRSRPTWPPLSRPTGHRGHGRWQPSSGRLATPRAGPRRSPRESGAARRRARRDGDVLRRAWRRPGAGLARSLDHAGQPRAVSVGLGRQLRAEVPGGDGAVGEGRPGQPASRRAMSLFARRTPACDLAKPPRRQCEPSVCRHPRGTLNRPRTAVNAPRSPPTMVVKRR